MKMSERYIKFVFDNTRNPKDVEIVGVTFGEISFAKEFLSHRLQDTVNEFIELSKEAKQNEAGEV